MNFINTIVNRVKDVAFTVGVEAWKTVNRKKIETKKVEVKLVTEEMKRLLTKLSDNYLNDVNEMKALQSQLETLSVFLKPEFAPQV